MPDIKVPEAVRRRRKRRRIALIAGGIGALAAAGILAFLLIPTGTAVSRSDLLIATVHSGRLAIRVQAPGTLEPEVRRWVTAAVPGVVEDVKVQPGDQVQADTVLAVLGNPKLKADLVTAKSDLATAQANLVSLKAQLQNQLLDLQSSLAGAKADAKAAQLKAEAEKGLVGDHVVSELDYQRAQLDADKYAEQLTLTHQRIDSFKNNMAAQVQAQQAKVDALKAALDEKQSEVDALQVQAGLAGVVQAVPVQNGQTLALGGNIARVASLKQLKAVLQVPPSEAGEVADGQSVALTLDVGGSADIDGKVSRVAPAVSNGSVDVDVALPAALPDGARPNLSVSGVVAIATLAHTLYVQRPVYSQPDSTQTLYKLTANGGAAAPVKVRFGRASDQAIQILSGLQPGDKVIVSDTSDFAGAKRVRIR